MLKASTILLFPLTVLFIGPIIHEVSHIVILETINCNYTLSAGLGFSGLFAAVQPYCNPGTLQLSIFYLIGYINTMVFGGFLSLYSLKSENKSKSLIYGTLGAGVLFSIVLTLSFKGDLINTAKILGLPLFYSHALTIILFIGCSASALRTLEQILDTSERQD